MGKLELEVDVDRESMLDFDNDRDASLKLIDWFEIDRVRAAKVMVVGAGAIGNEVLKNLALIGIGHVHIVDKDSIEASNLSRSILYRPSDIGRPKAATAARAVREINPDVRVVTQNGDVRIDIGLGLIRRMDVVIGCLDNREARISLNRKCLKMDRPWIDAGIGVLDGQVSVFKNGIGGCYECSFTREQYEQAAASCGQLASRYVRRGRVPTTPTIASLVAAVQVQETLKLLDADRWEGRSLAGREFVFKGAAGYTSIFGRPFNDACPAHAYVDPDLILELKGRRSDNTTPAELLTLARGQLGSEAHLELNFDMVVERCCPKCRGSKRFLRPRERTYFEDMTCEQCGGQGYEVVTKNLGIGATDYDEDFLDTPLNELGVPPLDMLRACGEGGTQIWLELSGDADQSLGLGLGPLESQ